MSKGLLEEIDQLRSENSALLLHINAMLHNRGGHSVASLTQIEAAKKDAEKSFNHIIKAGEVLKFGKYL
jgi:hypothetical protein